MEETCSLQTCRTCWEGIPKDQENNKLFPCLACALPNPCVSPNLITVTLNSHFFVITKLCNIHAFTQAFVSAQGAFCVYFFMANFGFNLWLSYHIDLQLCYSLPKAKLGVQPTFPQHHVLTPDIPLSLQLPIYLSTWSTRLCGFRGQEMCPVHDPISST